MFVDSEIKKNEGVWKLDVPVNEVVTTNTVMIRPGFWVRLPFLSGLTVWYSGVSALRTTLPITLSETIIETSTETNSRETMYLVGDGYRDGRGVKQNNTEACRRYQLGADEGDQYAQYNLGNCYWYGKGVGVNKNKATLLYGLSAEQGNDMAKVALADSSH